MATPSRCGKIDMKHGFVKSIIKNQVDRDNYDKEVKESKQNERRHVSNLDNRPKRPDAGVYVPPCRLETPQDVENDYSEEDDDDDDDDDDGPKDLFCFEFEDKDGKKYKQYVKEGIQANILAQRMGYNCRLSESMIKAMEGFLQAEIDKRTAQKGS